MGSHANCIRCGKNDFDHWSADDLGRVWCEPCTEAARAAMCPPRFPELRATIERAIVLALEAGLTGEYAAEGWLRAALSSAV